MPSRQGPHPSDLDVSRASAPKRWRLAGPLTLAVASGALSGCVGDPDCGVCDPDELVLESIAGVNYAGKLVKLLGPACVGDECPATLTEGQYFVEKIVPCVETRDAAEAPRGAEEWCKVSPMVVDSGLQFIFNNLLDPTSVELVRKQARDPQLFEVFDWKTRIVHLEGPIARFNGDYLRGATPQSPHLVPRAQSLSCIDNLRLQGLPYDHAVLAADPAVCDGTHVGPDGKTWPLRTQLVREDGEGRRRPTTVETYRGETDTRQAGGSCTPPQSGPDTCCDVCDFELAVNVAKYGLRGEPLGELERAGDRRRGFADAIACDPAGDKLLQCRDFVPHVFRGHEVREHEYTWNGARQRGRVPRADRVRETHPDDRPADVEQRTVPCESDQDCRSEQGAGLPGTECVGHLADDPAVGCRIGEDCVERRCVAEWFVDCRADPGTTGEHGYCVDRRWSDDGAAGCFTNLDPYYVCIATGTCDGEAFGDASRWQRSGSRMSLADADRDGRVEAIEGCRDALGGRDKTACEPLYQPGVRAIERYDRLPSLPSETRSCVCEDDPAPGCQDFVDSLCRIDADPARPIAPEKRGEYAVKFVTRNGGVVYDPALKGVLFLPADVGGVPRSMVETCAEGRVADVGELNIKDGWRANQNGVELFEDADRAMCSSSEYKVVFTSEPGPGAAPLEYIRDKVGNTLRGKSTYLLRTPDFHVVPGSGFPTDNLRIGACADFELRFSNKYDLDPRNLRKLEILEISLDSASVLGRVAGGLDCSQDPEQGVPCLTVNVQNQATAAVRVSIDARRFGGGHLKPGHRYRLQAPGLTLAADESVFDVIAAGGERYHAAFWDACGMPLVTSMPRPGVDPDHHYDFTIDQPSPKEDREQDGVQFSCDNAPDDFNPDQGDMDDDGFGDIIDLCPTLASGSNAGDADEDRIGNDCDRCSRPTDTYNKQADDSPAELYMRVRNIPSQTDTDQDGVGDVCDNCIVRPNCGGFGPAADGLRPAGIGDPVPYDDPGTCQADVDEQPFIGDACTPGGVPVQDEGAAAAVGLTNDDDFDQDGLVNISDRCPRQPVARRPCADNSDCELGAECDGVAKICNHVDSDGDGHGDLCDTCPSFKNPGQTLDGGMQADDADGDFIGAPCEPDIACADDSAARPIAFYSEVSNGQCCVQIFSESLGLVDPGLARIREQDGVCEVVDPAVPLKLDCPEDQENVTCRALPKAIHDRPGVTRLPPGCTQVGQPYTLESPEIAGDMNELYKHMCLMPPSDQDFDGIGDECDLCPFAFDPENGLYKDANGKVWPTNGKFCRGDYDSEKAQQTCEDLEGDESGSSSGESESTG